VISLQYQDRHIYDVIFVEIPQSILQKTVQRIYLLDPYTPEFTNPLPVEKDLIAIEVESKPDFPIPSFDPNIVPAGERRVFTECHVVGQSRGSYVNSKGGLVSLVTNHDRTGKMSFNLDVGEPGQSGTLLFVQGPDHTTGNRTDYKPLGIFHGMGAKSNKFASTQGVAAILPPFPRLTPLPVSNIFSSETFSSIESPSVTAHLADNGRCSVTCAASTHGVVSVKLTDDNKSSKYGVFMETKHNISYAGTKDWAVNGGSGTAAPLSFGRKRSFDETHG
jgi:hypothetical protein